jgi:hypothetical protein
MLDAEPIEADPVTTIRQELDRVSEIVIRSDVPVGVALSGGLDSSIITTLAAKKYPGTMHAISIGYPGRPWQDERSDAKELADHLGLPFHEIELSDEQMIESLPRIMCERDDPIGDLSGSSYYFVLKKARELNVPVMLSGHGGDELFWGYGWVRRALEATERKQRSLHNGSTGLRDYLTFERPPLSYSGGVRWLSSWGGLRTGLQQYRRDRTDPADRMVFYDLEPWFREAEGLLDSVYHPRWRQQIDSALQNLVVVAELNQALTVVGDHNRVLVDAGSAQGVQVGNIFTVIRQTDPITSGVGVDPSANQDLSFPVEDVVATVTKSGPDTLRKVIGWPSGDAACTVCSATVPAGTTMAAGWQRIWLWIGYGSVTVR